MSKKLEGEGPRKKPAADRASQKYAPGQSPKERIVTAAGQLFGEKGFHNTTTAELAAEAAVSIGQIYRHFDAKSDIVLAIVEQSVHERVAQMNRIFDAVERGECSILEALRSIIEISLSAGDISLSYEIMAESVRKVLVANRLETLIDTYREGVRRLAMLARPDVLADDLDAYVDVMLACFVGLGLRSAFNTATDISQTSTRTACLMLRALGLAENGDKI